LGADGVSVPATDRDVVAAARAAGAVDAGRWTIQVSLGRSRIEPLVLRTTAVVRAPQASSRPWIEHGIVVRNVGRKSVSLNDTRGSAYLSGPVQQALLGADEGCGYGRSAGDDGIDVGACAAYLDAPELGAGESIERTVTLFKGLPEMKRLRAGTYAFRKVISYEVGQRDPRRRYLRVVYDITPR
jgi:hypothetical protein